MNSNYSAIDIANYLVYLMSDVCEDLSNMKLNKLLYYAQGHYLQKTGLPLFSDDIEAWDHGPIINSVYQKYKINGSEHITEYEPARINCISDDIRDILLEVARVYGRYTASALRNMTHIPKSPWSMVYTEGDFHKRIPNDMIKDYFVHNMKELKPLEIDYSDEDIISKRDENDILVLPGEWDD